MENPLVLELTGNRPSQLCSSDGIIFCDLPYRYGIRFRKGEVLHETSNPETLKLIKSADDEGRDVTSIDGILENTVKFTHRLIQPANKSWIEEFIALENIADVPVVIDDLRFGFRKLLLREDTLRLIAVPFRIQVDGKCHDYTTENLLDGKYANSDDVMDWAEGTPPLADKNRLRSEAWLITAGESGILIAKYNNEHIEMSLAEVESSEENKPPCLRFGGAGFTLFSEPCTAKTLAPGERFTFGSSRYEFFQGGISEGYELYKTMLRERGHGFPDDYNPPVNWNELYDIGWYHNDQTKLKEFYSREKVLEEAAKASEIGCELLYLDPGWELCEGTSLWDEERLGKPAELVKELRDKYGLDLGFRDTGFLYRDEFPEKWYWCSNPDADRRKPRMLAYGPKVWRFCSASKPWLDEKIRRITGICRQGIKFMMFDEYAWFGPCYATDHGHSSPTTAEDHVRGMYYIIEEVRKACPDVLVEAHDPIWPWVSRYLPSYYRQGFGEKGSYEENWGFEFMWDCIRDLREGRARSLYYYAMGNDIPLYLHISIIPDNDNCLFFWWAASTVRHLGIGGKYHNYDPAIRDKYCTDAEARWIAYKMAMKTYKSLKPYFVRGHFHGIHEEAHLHTLDGKSGGVLNLFNLDDKSRSIEAVIPSVKLKMKPGSGLPKIPENVSTVWVGDELKITANLEPFSPCLVFICDIGKTW